MPREDQPDERDSTDEGLRSERQRLDRALTRSADAAAELATDVIAYARSQADTILSDTRDREDRALPADESVVELQHERDREDAMRERDRSGADADARDERDRERVALASLLAFERKDTDLRLELERARADLAVTRHEDFMAMASHDLRSLLGGIALSAELLKDASNWDDPFVRVASYAERIQGFSARMNRLVGDLMDITSIEAGKLALLRAPCSVARLLADAMEAFAPAARGLDLDLRCEAAGDPGTASLDHDRMLQVLTNLVGNAFKFTPRGGRIVIRVERRGDELWFAVADTGDGVPAELLEKIFERYFQRAEAERRGLGLGLYIAKSIVEGHGGRIWAESTPGEGTTFYVTVPAGLRA